MHVNFNQLGNLYPYLNYRFKNKILWNKYYNRLEHQKIKGSVKCTSAVAKEITAQLKSNHFNVEEYKIDVNNYQLYLKKANYHQFPSYYNGVNAAFTEKSLEHYLASQLLDITKEDIYVDIANGFSPAPDIYSQLFGCQSYKQDIVYPPGVHGRTIGGDASKMPVNDGFFSKMAMHCSFEHFEDPSDMNFVKEANRTLRQHGRLCIVPLYLFSEYAIQTNPVCVPKGFKFESDSRLYCVNDWNVHHSRFYDVPHLLQRVQKNLDKLNMTIYEITNAKEVSEACYVRYAAILEKQ